MKSFIKTFQFVSDKMRIIGAILLVLMTLLTCVDVVGRLLRHPVFGSVELMYLMGALAVAMALPDTHVSNGHIGVEIVVSKLSAKVRAIVVLITECLGLLLFLIVTWKMFEYSFKMHESGEVSMNLGLPEYAIIFIVACSFLMFVLAIFKKIVETIDKLRVK